MRARVTANVPGHWYRWVLLLYLLHLLHPGDRGQGLAAVAALASGHEAVPQVPHRGEDERYGEHDRPERVERGPAVPAVLLAVDVHRHRGVVGIGVQQVDQDEVIDDAGEHQHDAGEDRRGQERQHDTVGDLERA